MTLYSISRAAQRLGIDRHRLAKWARTGQVRAIKLEGQVKISVHELERIEKEGVPAAPKKGRRHLEPLGNIGDITIE